MRNEFVLSKSDSICKTCGGIGVLSLLSGIAICLLSNAMLLPIGLMLFNLGVVMLTEVFMYLFEIPKITLKFVNGVFVIGVSLAIVGAFCLFASSLPAIICLGMIGLADIMMLTLRYL